MSSPSVPIASDAAPPTAAPATSPGGRWLLPALTLWQREMVRFLRQRNRVIGALATPLMFWLVLGSGLNHAQVASPGGPSDQGMGYMAYFYPGTLVLILLFTAIFSTISVIEDRREGFLQAVLAAPAPRLAIVLGKVLGGASLAVGQGLLFLLLWPIAGGSLSLGGLLAAAGAMAVLSMGLMALGLCIAWPMDSTAGFHAIMNLFLMPMWFLCGAVFPVATAPVWMRAIMLANPLTYGYSVLARLLHGPGTPAAAVPLPLALT
ncbi:MAG TPA: ABC transporter permease, partial [Phycisphaeraceae bacterium]